MTTAHAFISPLAPVLERYLALKVALGRSYAAERAIFADLDRFLVAPDSPATDLTAAGFAQWSASLAHLTPGVRRRRMRIVRSLCLYRQRTEPGCFVPDATLFPRPHPPSQPGFFSEEAIARLLRATKGLRTNSTSPLHAEGYRLAVVLLYTAGLRRGELVRLSLSDYDAGERTLRIRATKFHKSRLLPLSDAAAQEIDGYLQARRRLPHLPAAPLLCNHHGGLRPYSGAGLAQGLRRLFRAAGVCTPAGRVPRVHDLRHSFALNALLRWYQAGVDVQAKLPVLAAYMGHVSIASTQYYLAFIEPLAQAVSDRFRRHCIPLLGDATAEGGRP